MDMVSGRGAGTVQSPANRLKSNGKDITCDMCSESGHVNSAEAFCQFCNEFMCRACIRLHNRFKANKDHTFINATDMLRQRPADVDKCSKHQDRPLEMYCTDEDVLGCTLCFAKEHRTCQNADEISNLSRDIEKSREMKDILQASEKHRVLWNRLRELIQKYRFQNDRCQSKCLEDYQSFRAEIEAALDILGEHVVKETDILQKKNTENLDSLAIQISSDEHLIDSCMDEINGCLALNQNPNDRLFIAVKRNHKQILDTANKLEQLCDNFHIQEFEFHYPHSIKQSLNNECKVKLKQTLSPATKCTDVYRINVESREDKTRCCISGIVAISEKLLLLTDKNNSCLKMVDIVSKTVNKRQGLTSEPWDITSFPGSRVAVSLPDIQQIQLFTADENLDPCEKIDVAGQCYGIQCNGKELVVSFIDPEPLVQIIDLNGTVIRSIQHGSSRQTLFKSPEYLTISDDKNRIYVTDDTKHTLTCMDVTGSVQWEYKNEKLKRPAGVATGDGGCVYISSWKSHTIHVVSPDGVRLAVIPQHHSGVPNPYAVSYSSAMRSLYLSSTNNSDLSNYVSRLILQ